MTADLSRVLKVDEIEWDLNHLTTERPSMLPWLERAGIAALGSESPPEVVEQALGRLRATLPFDLDPMSRQTLRMTLKHAMEAQGVCFTTALIDTALRPGPTSSVLPVTRKSQATHLVDLALNSGVELWHSPAGDSYITLPADGHREHYRLSATWVRDWLARRLYAVTHSTPGSQAISDALSVFSGLARYEGAEHEPSVRIGRRGEAVYLDLGDPTWRAVEITAAGWRIVQDSSARFVRSRGTDRLPEPVPGGSIEELRQLIHLASVDDFRLLVGWLLGALRPSGPYPLLSLVGEQGTGKSTVARMIRRLVDPHKAELRAEPRTVEDIMIAASRSRVVALDNLSHLPPWLSDAFCRVSTGGALTKRELYSNDEETIIEAMRPMIVTSIADVVTRGDLLDRTIVMTLPVMSKSERLSEAELWRNYESSRARILGALVDAVSSALAREQCMKLGDLPRMADWAVWVTAAEAAFDWPPGTILGAYKTMCDAATGAGLDGDPLAVAIRQIPRPWEGTASDLLVRVTPQGRLPRGWPETPRAISAALRRLAPSLRPLGIEVSTNREGGTGRRLITVTSPEGISGQSSQTSQVSQVPIFPGPFPTEGVTVHHLTSNDSDGCDALDGQASDEDKTDAGLF